MFIAFFPLPSLDVLSKSPALSDLFSEDLSRPTAAVSDKGIFLMSFNAPHPEWRDFSKKMLMGKAVEKDWGDHKAHCIVSFPEPDSIDNRMSIGLLIAIIGNQLGVEMAMFSHKAVGTTFLSCEISIQRPYLSLCGIEVIKDGSGIIVILKGLSILIDQDVACHSQIDPESYFEAVELLSSIANYTVTTGARFKDGEILPLPGGKTKTAVEMQDAKTGRPVFLFE